MEQLLPILVIVLALVVICLAAVIIKLYRYVSDLKASFAKLGFVVRQDLQQYFDSAAQRTIELQAQSTEHTQELIKQTMEKVLAESGEVMRETLANAEQQAGDIVLKAHQDRQQILEDAKKDSQQYLGRLTDYSAEALEWALEQLIKEKVDLAGHQELVQSLVSVYLNEHKRL